MTCERDPSGDVTTAPDTCPGGGAPRVLVRLSSTATCSSMLSGLLKTMPTARGKYQFGSAPPVVKNHYCVFQSGTGDAAAVPALLTALCGQSSVELAMHDCSTDPLVPSASDPSSFIVPEGWVTSGSPGSAHPTADQTDESGDGPHPCDACSILDDGTLYVNLPSSMTPSGNTTMAVRFLDSSAPDVIIHPPAGAQSFIVPSIDVANTSAVRIYPPGQAAPPK
jgi:hypothetical protein